MGLCLKESRSLFAEGLLPTVAIIMRDGVIIGRGHNRAGSHGTRPLLFDPTAHAEVTAIRDACGSLRTLDLSGSTIYVSMEPCPMCLWSIVHSKIDRLVLGGRHALVGRPDLGSYSIEALLAMTGRKHLEVVVGVLEEECVALRREFELLREIPVWDHQGGEKYA
jgi:tRNA(adenine34) deaminase